MRKEHTDHSINGLLRSRLFLSIEILVLILVGVALGKQVGQRYAIEREVNQLRAEFEELEQSSLDLKRLIGYFQSDTFKEEEARQRLNLRKEGESVVLLPEGQVVERSSNGDLTSNEQGRGSNTRRWWQYFFGTRSS
ncbi:MAG: hypothetical protein A2898_04655 [Candidatus Kerfeldbacteria bacterium RIFCSPLOWO2_01_FULL_48_11]|uniref:Cell division protein FtsL n=1 Tax=Candidatus Kerfeldbacteria bacterium RIFCSPLOWO2_01_FULL_48_11 TaxID=1798543 RepID=A0A1G2B2E8_9BACT|nr:MAG: Cell division protein FtsL [Parcubacteria group bacterium GW2011_GWA2_48_9]KKW16650.1 MAG: Cell division protein FtsL [Parcubacteria group bacterium GW2011_GWC2_49_9]OGY82849.1 MAG: hypothetical protein A2898_04655 [Candidatus Kerfeldbacteria bacterium RIFCSPLOWO2_01_FULL_48_11]HCJ52414.1 hypothetical protein [Candidatus Kerfeldbacteria bacterium]HCM68289.1 hypothetical protein [Candidatus Kerfeldbacteria bacterium]